MLPTVNEFISQHPNSRCRLVKSGNSIEVVASTRGADRAEQLHDAEAICTAAKNLGLTCKNSTTHMDVAINQVVWKITSFHDWRKPR